MKKEKEISRKKYNKWIKGVAIIASCCVIVGLAVFVVPKLRNEKNVDNPTDVVTRPTEIGRVTHTLSSAILQASSTITPTEAAVPSKNTITPTEITEVPLSITATPTEITGVPSSITVTPTAITEVPLSITATPTVYVDHYPTGSVLGEAEEISVGYDTGGSEKPMSAQRVAYKCPSFVGNGENLIVDVAVGDYSYTYNQEHNSEPSYDTYGIHGYPILQVFLCDPMRCENRIADDRFLVNGELNEYQRIYTKDEMSLIDLSWNDDISCGKHERIEIDFSNYKAGDTGEIAFCFSWSFGEQPNQKGSWPIHRQFLSFYVGEKGVSFGGDIELAEENYHKIVNRSFETRSELGHSCASKPYYLICNNEFEREFSHGNVIEKKV